MSRQLERKGAEYRKRFVSRTSPIKGVANNWGRCSYRNRPQVTGDNVVTPASWPSPEEPVALEKPIAFSDLRKEDLEEVVHLTILIVG